MSFADIEKYLDDDKKRPLFLEHSLFLFGLYYFPDFFTHKSAPFHKQRCKDFVEDKNLILIAFRESAKTVWTMIYLIYCICYKKINFCLFYSYEQTLAASRLFDVIVQLKINNRLIKDFGQLFPDSTTKKEDGLQKKSVAEFITTNNIKFKAMSINTSSRGMLYMSKHGAYRPDCVCLDDIDTIDSVRNPEIVNKNIEFLENEVFGALDSTAKIILLGNIITNIGIVPYFESKYKENKDWITNRQPIIDNGQITRDRFVHTDEERDTWKEQGIKKISLETKKREQKEQYEPNFMLIPSIRLGNPVFNHDIIHSLQEPEYKTDQRYKELKIYRPVSQDLVIGVDSSGGDSTDYGTIVARDRKRQLVLSFKGKYEPYQLAEVLEYIFSLGYAGLIVAENNSIGIATIDKLKQGICRNFLYTQKTIDKITQRSTKKYGFNTNAKSKALAISKLKEALHEKKIQEMDTRAKLELLHYYYDQRGATNALQGHNDDLVIAEMLCEFGQQQHNSFIFV